MKKIIFAIIVLFLFGRAVYAQQDTGDLTQKPAPLQKSEFSFPKYTEKTLTNGLKLFIVEDHEQPMVAFRFLIGGGISMEGDKYGLAELTASLLTKGAGKRSAQDMAKALDGVGAYISADASPDYISVYASSLKKHLPLLLEILSDVILKPEFSDDELEKLIKKKISQIQYDKSNPGYIADALAKKVIYGENHPYAHIPTESIIKDIDEDDIFDFYKSYFKPKNTTLAIIGDVKPDEIIDKINKYFGSWEKGNPPRYKLPEPTPMPIGVYFVERPGSVQSSILVTTKAIPINHPEYETLDMAASVIGAGFAGRLFKLIRETYSFSYNSFGYITESKYANRFVCGADVRSSATDSSLRIILEQLKLLSEQAGSNEEIERVKKYVVGKYLLSFENSNFIARLIQDADFNGLDIKKVQNYPVRMQSINPYNILDIAKKYMNPNSASIIVVGSPELRKSLEEFGKIYDYDLDLKPLSGEKGLFEKVSLDAKEIIDNYITAIGGRSNIDSVYTIIDTAQAKITINNKIFQGPLYQYQKAPNKKYIYFRALSQEFWIDGEKAWTLAAGNFTESTGTELEKFLFDATIFNEIKLIELGFKCTVLGKQKDLILMKAESPKGLKSTYYFDSKTFLIKKIERLEETSQGTIPITINFDEYSSINGILLPKKIETINPLYVMTTENKYYINLPLEDDVFIPRKE